MAKKDLISLADRTTEEQQEIARKGGIASGKARRERKKLRESLEELLARTQIGKNGEELTGADAISIKLFEQALKGNVKAFKTIRDTVGEKPVENVQIAKVDQEAIDDINEMLEEASNNVETETEKFIDK